MADPVAAASLTPHTRFPHIPAKCKVRSDPACSGCAMAATAGHETVSEITPNEALAEAERMRAVEISGWQWMLKRMGIDSDGVPGAYNDVYMDGWYPYNARGSVNYADAMTFDVTGVSGSQITLKTPDGSDAGDRFLFNKYVPNPDYGLSAGLPRLLVETYTGAVQPGMVLQPSGNSKLALTCWPIVTAVVSCVGDTLIVDTDKDMTALLTKYDSEGDEISVKVWHHAGNPETWRLVVKPDYFYGVQRIKNIPAAAVPEDGLVKLADAAVKDIHSFDPLHPTWTLEGKRIDNDEWEVVSDRNSRLYCLPDQAWVALKTTKPAEGTTAPGSDLTLTYDAFRATFWEYVGPEAKSCTVVGHARCVHSVPVSGLGYTPPDGSGGGYMCMKRRYDVNTPTDSDDDGFIDSNVHTVEAATGASRFPANGLCMQYNCCDQYEPAETSGELYAPFTVRDMRAVHELVGCVNQRLLRIIPRVAGFFAWQAQRVAHPSIMWHHGYVALATPNGVEHELSVFRGMGMWGLDYYVYEDDSGNESLDLVTGGMDGVKHGPWVTNDGNVLIDTDGQLLSLPGYNPKRDPVTPGATVTERELERIGAAVEKDSGDLQTYAGLAHSSVAVESQNVVIPNVDVAGDGVQVRSGGSFERTVGTGGEVRLQILRQAAKSAHSLGSRKVAAVSGSGVVTLELANVQHTYSQVSIPQNPGTGETYDQKWTWDGGGVFPILPVDGHRVDSYYEPNKIAGSRAVGAWAGDSIKVGDRWFVIESTEAHGGSDAGNWGEDTYKKWEYSVPAIWRPDRDNLEFTDDDGNEYYGAAVLVSVKNTSTSAALTVIESAERPASIAAGEYWWDGDALYVGAAVSLQIDYTVADPLNTEEPPPPPTAYTEYVTVPADIDVPTDITSADWTDADSAVVLVDGNTPATGYSADTGGTYVVLTFALVDAVKAADITLTWEGVEPDSPGDRYCVTQDYTDFGRKRDVVHVFDDADGFVAALTPGTDVAFYKAGDAVALPGWGLEWTAYGTDDWAAVTGAVIQAGSGVAMIPEAWFADKSGAVCFRATGVKLMDHRGIFPASLWEKIREWMRADKWVRCGMGSGRGGWVYSKTYSQGAWIDSGGVVVGSVNESAGPGGNSFFRGLTFDSWTPPGPATIIQASVSLNITAIAFGMPLPLLLVPDGTVIVSAKAEVSASNMVRESVVGNVGTYECSGGTPASSTFSDALENIDYTFIGIKGDDFTTLGSVTPTDYEHRSIVDLTDILQKMFDHRSDGLYDGFGLAAFPKDVGGPDLNLIDLLPDIPDTTEVPMCSGGTDYTVTGWADNYSTSLEWDNISIGTIAIKLRYPDGTLDEAIILPQLPSQE